MEMFYDVFLVSGCKLKMWPRPMLTRQLSGCRWLFILLSFRGKYGCDMLWTATKLLFWNYSHVNLLYSKFRRDPLLGPLFSWHELYSLSTVSGFPDFLPAVGKPQEVEETAADGSSTSSSSTSESTSSSTSTEESTSTTSTIPDAPTTSSTSRSLEPMFGVGTLSVWKSASVYEKNKHLIFAINGLEDEFISFWCVFFCCFSGGSVRITHTHTHLHGSFWTKL